METAVHIVAAGHPIGVLGVSERSAGMPPNVERMVAATALAGASIRNVQLFQNWETAVTDALTGCVNRARFLEMIEKPRCGARSAPVRRCRFS